MEGLFHASDSILQIFLWDIKKLKAFKTSLVKHPHFLFDILLNKTGIQERDHL